MSSTAVTPTTLVGIKRLAKSIKREHQVPHWKALDVAAARAGYPNFRNAQNKLAAARPKAPRTRGHPIWITAYWRDKDQDSGRETLRVFSRHRWGSLLRAQDLQSSRGLCEFRVDADDHLESRRDLADQDTARRKVCEAARTLQFMDATGLRPLTGRMPHIASKKVHDLPLRDHASTWCDPSGRCYVVDEPYVEADQVLLAREPWAREHGAAVGATTWPGMYYPGLARLYLASLDGDAEGIKKLVRILDAEPAPIVPEHWTGEPAWSGESAPYAPQFISPARAASGRKKRGRLRPLYFGQRRHDAVCYGQLIDGGCWRPDARMPLEAHRTAGNLLKEIINVGGFRSRASGDVQRVRSELDEWVQREYPSQEKLSSKEFGNLYYYEFKPNGCGSIDALTRVEELLRAHYPDCVPRRGLLRRLAAAKKDLARWDR